MAAGTERSKALHNFTLPSGLRWGIQRHLRCVKVESNDQVQPLNRFTGNGSGSLDHDQGLPIQQRRGERGFFGSELVFGGSSGTNGETKEFDGGCGSGDCKGGVVSTVREEVMLDIQMAAAEFKDAIFRDIRGEGVVSPSPPPPSHPAEMPVEGETSRPWNLRKRRAEFKIPASGFVSDVSGGGSAAGRMNGCGGEKRLQVDEFRGSGIPPVRVEAAINRPSRLRNGGNSVALREEKRPKFSISLSKREIEEDFFAITGQKLPRKPKKRPKNVQKQLDSLFPGLWLTEVSPDMY